MKSNLPKRIFLGAGLGFLALVMVLGIHIYIVTRPKAPDANTIVMARIDLKQPITADEADKITAWFYGQAGIDHVLCNASMGNVVFTYYPVKVNADDIAGRFRLGMQYANAVRYVPSEKDLRSGCPVATTSYSYKMYNFFRNTF